MADMTTIKGRIAETIYPNGKGAITAESHQALLLEMVDDINELKQDTLVSGQNIRPLISGESLLGSDALGVLGTKFIYELENQQLFAMIDGAQQDFHIWMANRAVYSQVAQVIEIQKEGYFKELVPLTIKNKAGVAVLCWEYDGMIYEASMEDNVLTVVSKPKGEEFDKQGNYPLLHVGTADDLAGRGESVPAEFTFRASGGKSIKDGRAYIKRIKGNSVVWNQLRDVSIKARNEDKYGISVSTTLGSSLISCVGTYDGSTGDSNIYNQQEFPSIPAIVGHKYLCMIVGNEKMQLTVFGLGATASQIDFYAIVQCTAEGFVNLIPRINTNLASGTEINESIQFLCYDLTQMFQAGNEPTTIEEFYARKPIVEDEYAYNEGEVIHCNTESIKSVGDNAWDEEVELGSISSTDGENIPNDNAIRPKNYIKILPNEQYHINVPFNEHLIFYDERKQFLSTLWQSSVKTFTTPSNAAYMRFCFNSSYGTTYNHDIMISLVHSGWKQDTDAGYQPYWQDTLPLPIIRKYFPQGMKSAGSAHDEIRYNKASGKWEYSNGKIKSVDLGDLDWSYYPAADVYPFGFFYANPQGRKYGVKNILCGKYAFGHFANDKSILGNSDGENIYIMDSAYTDAASFKAMLQEKQVKLYYESNNWEWVELDAEDQNFRDYYNVADFGTEQSQSEVPSAPFSADIIYQFNAVDMIREHEIEINELQKVIETMQSQLTSLINGGQ